MNKYTPETLKAVVKRLAGRRKGWSPSVLEVVLEIHADAWQEQVERLERERETLHGQIDGETKALLARIEALEETVCGAKAIIDDLEGQLNRSLEEP